MKTLYEETIGSERIYEGRVINLRRDTARLQNGAEVTREVIEHPGGVSVAAFLGDDLLMVRQFRYAPKKVLLEIPAGKLNYGEDPLDCGKRELEEETGYQADEFISLGKMLPTCAYDEEVIHLYLAKGLHKTHQHLDDDEFLDVEPMNFEKLVDMVLANEIEDAKTQVIILKLKLLRDAGRI
ncbi:NUDIX domain-containing protein [Zongyangia hominis]|uniref:NUDIX hydrolase n=1 Tax=Zongyangia hominis TaxID=2763677 RepID=A0A926EDZ3_9FIRM|nr:NUDIX hydrolase [Zongyangia hominis]MBC8570679.1 NUDIX hydrolase [Zongyangia hominis]